MQLFKWMFIGLVAFLPPLTAALYFLKISFSAVFIDFYIDCFYVFTIVNCLVRGHRQGKAEYKSNKQTNKIMKIKNILLNTVKLIEFLFN